MMNNVTIKRNRRKKTMDFITHRHDDYDTDLDYWKDMHDLMSEAFSNVEKIIQQIEAKKGATP